MPPTQDLRRSLSAALLAAGLLALPAFGQSPVRSTATAPFPHFESGPSRALLLAPGGGALYALNTPDHRVEVFALADGGPGEAPAMSYDGSIFTGLEPVSMALHPADPDTLFVANLLSDSVSVVDLAERQVVATIQVGDEPQDLAVAGDRLVVTCGRSPLSPDLLAPADFVENAVVVASAVAPYDVLAVIGIEGHRPRGVAAVGDLAYVVPLNSGNHTTSLNPVQLGDLGMDQLTVDAFDDPFDVNPGLLSPDIETGGFDNNPFGVNGWVVPQTARIVLDSEYPTMVPQLPDADVHVVDVPTASLLPQRATGVGTTLFGIGVNPVTGDLWVPNTDANNRTRFEPRVQGAAVDNRITVVDAAGVVQDVISLAPPLTSAEHAQPVAVAFAADGQGGGTAYVAALGTATVVALDAATGALVDEIATATLPSALAVDPARDLLYVFTRGDKTIRSYHVAPGHPASGRAVTLPYDPEPAIVSAGREVLYDAREATGAGNGNMSCASCHVFGHMDALAWDLGNPESSWGYFFPDLMTGEVSFDGLKVANKQASMTHPMKGPMVTQTLRGLGDVSGPPLHWRGDRRFVQIFRGAFPGLLGGDGIDPATMQAFAGFLRDLAFPPNPYQRRDRAYTGTTADGADTYGMNEQLSGKTYNLLTPGVSCIDCHKGNFLDGSDFTGSQLTVNFDGEDQLFNAPTMRGIYEKEFRELTGFGTVHDGTLDGAREFLDAEFMGFEAFELLTPSERDDVAAFIRAWDTGTSPLVGRQHTTALTVPNLLAWLDFLDLAEAEALPEQGNVDLVARLHVALPGGGSLEVGAVFTEDPSDGQWRWLVDVDRFVDRSVLEQLVFLGLVEGTFTAVPPGLGHRLGVDRDEDGLLDGREGLVGAAPWSPDTDRDGYDDALEVAAGGNPAVADAFLPGDATAPTVTASEPRDVFADVATLHLLLDEPGTVSVSAGTSAGAGDLGTFVAGELRRVQDVVLSGLPAAAEVFWTATTSDKNGNTAESSGSFTTAPPHFHVADMTIASEGTGPFTVTATVTVVDQSEAPAVGVPVKVLWAGDLGGMDFFPPVETTDITGTATFVLGPFDPAGPTTITATPAFIGTNKDDLPFFIGFGGDDPTFFYNQSFNAVNYRSVDLP